MSEEIVNKFNYLTILMDAYMYQYQLEMHKLILNPSVSMSFSLDKVSDMLIKEKK